MRDRWDDATTYDRFMGRWSRQLAVELVEWLGVAPGANWLEVGCGTGSLTRAILETAQPRRVVACDTARAYVDHCTSTLHSERLEVVCVQPGELPGRDGTFDVVASSLVLNFLPDAAQALRQMRDLCTENGCVAAAVWDYSDGMEFLRYFWDAAVAITPDASVHDEGRRFPICTPSALRQAFVAAGLESPTVESITIPTVFSSFEDYWSSFLDGPGPAPTFLSSLPSAMQQSLASMLRTRLPTGSDGSISLRARAWTARGRRGTAEQPL